MIDPDLKYCPKCNDEYLSEIEVCAGCGINLITGQQKIEMEEARRKKLQGRKLELDPEDDLVTLQRGPLADIRRLAELLQSETIGTLIVGDEKSCGQSCCPTVYNLCTRREDAMEAMQIIDAEHRRTTGLAHHDCLQEDIVFNPYAGEAKCPACGHAFPTTLKACPDCGLNFG